MADIRLYRIADLAKVYEEICEEMRENSNTKNRYVSIEGFNDEIFRRLLERSEDYLQLQQIIQ
ncbi:hypothetical protein MUP00_04745 [Candidatus Bathyarchaeota archaeon]|nr:hypothetical protein [Candidatus Bathyarchaeota archaeon]